MTIQQRDSPSSVPVTEVWLDTRGGTAALIAGTRELAALLSELNEDQSVRADLEEAAGMSLAPLLLAGTPREEPDWLRAAEMLDEEQACPGERLFARSLSTVATWWEPGEVRAAAEALAGATGEARIAEGCTALARATSTVARAERVRILRGLPA